MSAAITGLCREHSFETSVDICRRCAKEYCSDCLVHPFGNRKPYCKECALVAGGVKAHSTRPAPPKRIVKARVKAFRAARGDDAPAVVEEEPDLIDPTLQAWLDAPDQAGRTAPLEPNPNPAGPRGMPEPAFGPDVAAPVAVADEPADGVAPPIDWSRPFG